MSSPSSLESSERHQPASPRIDPALPQEKVFLQVASHAAQYRAVVHNSFDVLISIVGLHVHFSDLTGFLICELF